MKKIILASAIALAFGSSYVFAHHPAADIVDPDIYAMIDENVSDTHADMDLDTLGSDDNMGGSVDADGTGSNAAADIEVGQGAGGPRN